MWHSVMIFKLKIKFFKTETTTTEMSDPLYLDKPWRKFPEFNAEVQYGRTMFFSILNIC